MQAAFKAYEAADKHWVPIFQQKLEIVPFPAKERAELAAASVPIWQAWATDLDRQGLKGSEMLKFAREQAEQFKDAR